MERGGRFAGTAAGLAALVGAGLLGYALVRLAGGDAEDPAATTVGAVTTAPGPSTTTVGGEGYVTVTDDTARISARVPADWTDVGGSAWIRSNMEVGPSLAASVDIGRWVEAWDTPGIFIGVDELTGRTVGEALGGADFEGTCTRVSREPYRRGGYAGEIERYVGCGDAGSTFIQVAATGPAGLVFVQLVVLDPSQADPVLAGWSVAAG